MWIRVGAVALALAACKYTAPPDQVGSDAAVDTPVDMPLPPDVPPDTTPRPYVALDDATTGGTAGFYLFAPHGTSTDATPFPGTFQNFGTTRVKADVINIACDVDGPTEGTLVATLNVVVMGAPPNTKYQASKNVTLIGSGLVVGNCYRIKPTLDGVGLGYTDLQVTSGTPPAPFHRATPGSNLTVRFRTEDSLN